MKKSLLFIVSFLTLFSCSNDKNQEVVKSYINAHNAHDIEKALAFYDENVVFELQGVWIKEGLSEMQSLEEWDASLNSNLRLESISSKEDSVFCRVVENNDWFGAVEIHDLVHDPAVFIIENRKIKKIIGYPSPETGKEIEAAIGSLYQWSQKVQDSTINELILNGQFIYSTEAAEKWLDLFDNWKNSDSLK
ncbi:MAG: hypothetical protein DHS20C13_30200 [Thermodesulfobacteriota bacterium]|nr:MAG: hypothetical protein DHS20C13_30200 [Thermodesulfobacteriota bacterium]